MSIQDWFLPFLMTLLSKASRLVYVRLWLEGLHGWQPSVRVRVGLVRDKIRFRFEGVRLGLGLVYVTISLHCGTGAGRLIPSWEKKSKELKPRNGFGYFTFLGSQ